MEKYLAILLIFLGTTLSFLNESLAKACQQLQKRILKKDVPLWNVRLPILIISLLFLSVGYYFSFFSV